MTNHRFIRVEPRRLRSARHGIALVELVIGVLIMSIMAAVAAPRFTGALDHYRVEAAAVRIAADLNYVRRVAMHTSSNRGVEFTIHRAGNHSYKSVGVTGTPSLTHPGDSLNVRFNAVLPGVDLVSVSFDGQLDVEFNHYGLPLAGDPGSGIAMSALSSGQIVIAAGSEQRTISVDPASGKAAVQ